MRPHQTSHSNYSVRSLLRDSWQILVAMIVGFFSLAYVAWGATYNFYFNNTEQGDNSTATPSLTVSEDGKVVKKSGTADDATKTENALAPAAAEPAQAVPAASSTASAKVPAEGGDGGDPHWRLVLGATTLKAYGENSGASLDGNIRPSISGSYFFNRDIGLTAFGAMLPGMGYSYADSDTHWMGGLELEISPIHISIGRVDNLLEIGFVGGVEAEYHHMESYGMGYYSGSTYYGSAITESGDDWKIRPEAGIRVSLNLGRSWGITADARATRDYATGEAALALRF